ncbi:hypothetical protein HOY80DRAFT_1116562 [Tuber brumale]|nr:hypothetical protein HOY80DRAFT_1116562 [Tuber brumale]
MPVASPKPLSKRSPALQSHRARTKNNALVPLWPYRRHQPQRLLPLLWALGPKAPTSRNIKIGAGSRKTMSKFVRIKDPHGDGVRAIVKDKTTTFLKVKKEQVKKAKKTAGLRRKRDAGESHHEMVRAHEEKKERELQEKAMAGKGTGEILEETIRMRRDKRGMMQLWVQTRRKG